MVKIFENNNKLIVTTVLCIIYWCEINAAANSTTDAMHTLNTVSGSFRRGNKRRITTTEDKSYHPKKRNNVFRDGQDKNVPKRKNYKRKQRESITQNDHTEKWSIEEFTSGSSEDSETSQNIKLHLKETTPTEFRMQSGNKDNIRRHHVDQKTKGKEKKEADAANNWLQVITSIEEKKSADKSKLKPRHVSRQKKNSTKRIMPYTKAYELEEELSVSGHYSKQRQDEISSNLYGDRGLEPKQYNVTTKTNKNNVLQDQSDNNVELKVLRAGYEDERENNPKYYKSESRLQHENKYDDQTGHRGLITSSEEGRDKNKFEKEANLFTHMWSSEEEKSNQPKQDEGKMDHRGRKPQHFEDNIEYRISKHHHSEDETEYNVPKRQYFENENKYRDRKHEYDEERKRHNVPKSQYDENKKKNSIPKHQHSEEKKKKNNKRELQSSEGDNKYSASKYQYNDDRKRHSSSKHEFDKNRSKHKDPEDEKKHSTSKYHHNKDDKKYSASKHDENKKKFSTSKHHRDDDHEIDRYVPKHQDTRDKKKYTFPKHHSSEDEWNGSVDKHQNLDTGREQSTSKHNSNRIRNEKIQNKISKNHTSGRGKDDTDDAIKLMKFKHKLIQEKPVYPDIYRPIREPSTTHHGARQQYHEIKDIRTDTLSREEPSSELEDTQTTTPMVKTVKLRNKLDYKKEDSLNILRSTRMPPAYELMEE